MTDKIDDGGLAFPGERAEKVALANGGDQWAVASHAGLTVRDWFAGEALSGICANGAWNDTFHRSVAEAAAKAAYQMADAMIAARKGGTS